MPDSSQALPFPDLSKLAIEQLLQIVTYWEDIDSTLQVISRDEEGGVCIADPEWKNVVGADTLREALEEMIKRRWNEYYQLRYEYVMECLDEIPHS